MGDGEYEINDDIGEASGKGTVTAVIPGSPDNWVPPQPPPSFTGYVQKHDAPSEDDINPAQWSMFTFTATFDKKNKYLYHTTPSNARVVPINSSGKRDLNGWEFHYQNWSADEEVKQTYARGGATCQNLKPKSRAGCLDVNVLKKHGLNAARFHSDPLFFFQMIFPICNPMESGVTDDHHHPYFSNVVPFTNMYAYWKGAGSGYGNDFPPVSITKLVHWTGVPIWNGALDGKQSTLKHQWNRLDPRFDSAITNSIISNERWRQIKGYFKLSVGLLEKPRGTTGYDPCVKYDYIWRCLVHNMNYVTAQADLDCTIDETTWGFSGYSGKAGSRLKNKPSPATRPTGFQQQGPAEVHYLCKEVIQMLQGPSANNNEMRVTMCNQMTVKEYFVPKKKIYKKLPHIVADNHFSGENVMQYIGSKGFGITATCQRDRFLPGLKEFLHHEKVPSIDKRTSRRSKRMETKRHTHRQWCLFNLLQEQT
jgi:hypothetical protein